MEIEQNEVAIERFSQLKSVSYKEKAETSVVLKPKDAQNKRVNNSIKAARGC